MVCGVSSFLLRKSGNALLGQTLPQWRVKRLIMELEGHPAVVNVYDVKTEIMGTDTVRFKAEVQFNPQVITERMLEGRPDADCEFTASYAELAKRLHKILPLLSRSLPMKAARS